MWVYGQGVGYSVWDVERRMQNLTYWVSGISDYTLECNAWDIEFKVRGVGFMVCGLGVRVQPSFSRN